ncbi:hypothetical protein [Kaistella yonginensis]|uniref:hypothetical protein n=1 Tax=Kaistella yonginensis TaxID=658267 RepID=UPI0025B4C477|nr:hypothetical protein [Kaistella yonginensis]MDN3607056.1 hypothetical protein [Kaistella yonginensis]
MKDPEKSASAVNLVYTNDNDTEGIIRKKSGKSFSYFSGQQRVIDKNEIKRINELAIPPAWEKVWICALQNGHLQATGLDAKKRKQYRYHPLSSAVDRFEKAH